MTGRDSEKHAPADCSAHESAIGRILAADDHHEDVEFSAADFSPLSIGNRTFVNCSFSSCHFREMALSGATFSACVFKACEVVLVAMHNVTLTDTLFDSCKIMGVNFAACNPAGFSPSFTNCAVGNSVFDGLRCKKMKMTGCLLTDCDLTSCDFSGADFSETGFSRVAINACNFEKADFRSSHGYAIDPATNRLQSARFSLPEARSFLPFLGIRLDD